MRRAIGAFVVAAFIALPFTFGAPAANAQEGGLHVDIPGILHRCVRISSPCG
jgi:hypothetical protein